MYSVHGGFDAVEKAFAKAFHIDPEFASQFTYVLEGAEAVNHLFRLASGLESLVVGEDEILGQIRRALAAAQAKGSTGLVLTRMFQEALAVGKRVRSETDINRFPASVSAAAACIVRDRSGTGSLDNLSVLVIGAGDMGRAVTHCLKGMNTRDIAVANRTHSTADELARKAGAKTLDWPPQPEVLAQYDAVISCTSAPGFVLTRSMVEETVRSLPPGKRIQLLDIAVPRDIDPGVASVRGVNLTNIDDARSVVADSVSKRHQYVEPAERIIREQLEGFLDWLEARSVSDSIRVLRERADSIRVAELDWLVPKLSGLSPSDRQLLEQFSSRLVNKLLHAPTLKLKETQARSDSDPSIRELMLHVFDLEGEECRTRAKPGEHLCNAG